MSRVIATFFYVGYLRPAPGTWGSLAALPCAWALLSIAPWWVLPLAAALLYIAGLKATEAMTKGSDNHDPSEIVVDEVVGQWIALVPVAYGAALMDVPLLALWPGWIAAFALFRLFDIRKPWLVGRADARGDATGVMLDDVWAGLFAAIGVVLLGAGYHLLWM